jgi:hypothetical protein
MGEAGDLQLSILGTGHMAMTISHAFHQAFWFPAQLSYMMYMTTYYSTYLPG